MPATKNPAQSHPAGSNLAETAVRSVIWVSIEKWGTRLVSLFVFALLGRLLDPTDFGLVALAAVFTSILSIFVDSGFSQVLIQREKVSEKQIATAFWSSMSLAVAAYALLAIAAHPLAELYHEPKLEILLYVLGLQLPIAALSSTPAALLERNFAFRTLTIRQLSGIVAGAVGGVVAALAGLGVWALVIQSVGGVTVSCAVLWIKSDWRPVMQYSTVLMKEMLGFGASILGTEAVNLVNAQADKLIVGSVLGPKALGYYYVGSRILNLVSDSFTVVIAEVSFTTFSRLQDQPERLVRAYNKATFTSAALALPAFGALFVLAPALVPLLFGDKWTASVTIMLILTPSAALNSVLYFDKSALLARGFGRDTFLLAVANTVLGLAFVAAASPWGANGVATSRSLRQFAFWPVRLTVLRKRLGLQIVVYLKQFIKPVVATAITMAAMALTLLPLPDIPILQVAAAGTVGALAYAAAVMLVARTEVEPVLRAMRRKRAGRSVALQPAAADGRV